jgi:hypothetical protein
MFTQGQPRNCKNMGSYPLKEMITIQICKGLPKLRYNISLLNLSYTTPKDLFENSCALLDV